MNVRRPAWGDLVRSETDGPLMFVSSPDLGDQHCWEGVRNGVYCIWHDGSEDRWEIYPHQNLQVVSRPLITDPTDPAQAYEVVTQETIKTLRRLTMGAFDMPKQVQQRQYELATSAYEMWIATVNDSAIASDREYLEMLIDQNPIVHADDFLKSATPDTLSES